MELHPPFEANQVPSGQDRPRSVGQGEVKARLHVTRGVGVAKAPPGELDIGQHRHVRTVDEDVDVIITRGHECEDDVEPLDLKTRYRTMSSMTADSLPVAPTRRPHGRRGCGGIARLDSEEVLLHP